MSLRLVKYTRMPWCWSQVRLEIPAGSVVTPHPAEAARLLGIDTAAVQANRPAAARALAARHPQVQWRWLDIEDDAELLGDLDVETLPTLLVGRGDQVLFYGPVLPKLELLSRLIETLAAQSEDAGDITDEVVALWQQLRD